MLPCAGKKLGGGFFYFSHNPEIVMFDEKIHGRHTKNTESQIKNANNFLIIRK